MSRVKDVKETNEIITKAGADLLKNGVKSTTLTNFELSAIRSFLAEISMSMAMIADEMTKDSDKKVVESVKEAMCERFCKYPNEWNAEKEGCELSESILCKACPTNLL